MLLFVGVERKEAGGNQFGTHHFEGRDAFGVADYVDQVRTLELGPYALHRRHSAEKGGARVLVVSADDPQLAVVSLRG